MALLNFPANPQVGDKYTIGVITWQWTGSAWIRYNDPNKTFGEVTATQMVITTTTNSTSTTTGALVVTGGAAIGGNLFVGGQLIGPGAAALSTSTDAVRNGTTGSVLYQIAPSVTGFIGIGTTGSFLVSNGTTSTFKNTVTNITITDTTRATNTTTGALVVAGGVGIGGDLFVGGDFYANGHPVLTTATFGAVISAGVDITVTFITGTNYIQINDISTLQSVTGRGFTTTNRINITNATASVSTTTGALTVKGGVGIGGDVNIYGRMNSESVRILDTIFDSTRTTVNTVVTTVIDTYSLADFRSAKYLVQIDEGSGASAEFQSSELLLLATNTGTVYLTEYASISSRGVGITLGEFSADLNNVGGTDYIRLKFTADSATSKTINVLRTAMVP
jgi:hypothetical protein